MNAEHAVTVNAPAAHVWAVFTDVVRWPEWTPSVRHVEVVEPGEIADEAATLAIGTGVRIAQPKMPALTWVVTELTAGRSWTWTATSPGVVTTATHEVDAIDATSCRVRQVVEHRGPLAGVAGLLTGSRTRRYLDQEATGLKQRAESTWSTDAPAP